MKGSLPLCLAKHLVICINFLKRFLPISRAVAKADDDVRTAWQPEPGIALSAHSPLWHLHLVFGIIQTGSHLPDLEETHHDFEFLL